MAHFAKVENGIVTDVIVADQTFIDSGVLGDPTLWVQTSYNTYGNVHYAPSPPAEPMTPDGGTPLNYNYAGIGYSYDRTKDAFIPPKPFASWVLNDDTCLWGAPTPMPTDDKFYDWDETTTSWKEVVEA
jgi:hypothetical protein